MRELCFLTLLIAIGLSCESGPNRSPESVQKELDAILSQEDSSGRTASVTRLLDELRDNTRGITDDHVIQAAFAHLQRSYEQSGDDAILVAVDATRFDGGFANYGCEFYRALMDDERFRARYAANPGLREALVRCEGITFGQGEVNDLLVN